MANNRETPSFSGPPTQAAPIQFSVGTLFDITSFCAVVCAVMLLDRSREWRLTVLMVAVAYLLYAAVVVWRNRETLVLYEALTGAMELMRDEKYAEALNRLSRIPRLAQDDLRAAALVWRGSCHALAGDFDKAVADYTKSLSLRSGHRAVAFANRGEVLLHKNLLSEAIRDCSEALKLDPSESDAFYNRGRAQARRKKFTEAIDDFDAAIALDSQFAAAFWEKAAALEATGRHAEAETFRIQSMKIDPAHGAGPPQVVMRWPN